MQYADLVIPQVGQQILVWRKTEQNSTVDEKGFTMYAYKNIAKNATGGIITAKNFLWNFKKLII